VYTERQSREAWRGIDDGFRLWRSPFKAWPIAPHGGKLLMAIPLAIDWSSFGAPWAAAGCGAMMRLGVCRDLPLVFSIAAIGVSTTPSLPQTDSTTNGAGETIGRAFVHRFSVLLDARFDGLVVGHRGSRCRCWDCVHYCFSASTMVRLIVGGVAFRGVLLRGRKKSSGAVY